MLLEIINQDRSKNIQNDKFYMPAKFHANQNTFERVMALLKLDFVSNFSIFLSENFILL